MARTYRATLANDTPVTVTFDGRATKAIRVYNDAAVGGTDLIVSLPAILGADTDLIKPGENELYQLQGGPGDNIDSVVVRGNGAVPRVKVVSGRM